MATSLDSSTTGGELQPEMRTEDGIVDLRLAPKVSEKLGTSSSSCHSRHSSSSGQQTPCRAGRFTMSLCIPQENDHWVNRSSLPAKVERTATSTTARATSPGYSLPSFSVSSTSHLATLGGPAGQRNVSAYEKQATDDFLRLLTKAQSLSAQLATTAGRVVVVEEEDERRNGTRERRRRRNQVLAAYDCGRRNESGATQSGPATATTASVSARHSLRDTLRLSERKDSSRVLYSPVLRGSGGSRGGLRLNTVDRETLKTYVQQQVKLVSKLSCDLEILNQLKADFYKMVSQAPPHEKFQILQTLQDHVGDEGDPSFGAHISQLGAVDRMLAESRTLNCWIWIYHAAFIMLAMVFVL